MHPPIEEPTDRPQERPLGRPAKLTPEIQARLVEALRAGNTRDAAARRAGIVRSTFYEWLERGRNPEYTRRGKLRANCKDFVDFADTVLALVGLIGGILGLLWGWKSHKAKMAMLALQRQRETLEIERLRAGAGGDEADRLVDPAS